MSFGFLVIKVYNHGEHYETSCIIGWICILYLHIIICDILIYNYMCSFLPMSAFHIAHVTA